MYPETKLNIVKNYRICVTSVICLSGGLSHIKKDTFDLYFTVQNRKNPSYHNLNCNVFNGGYSYQSGNSYK